MEPPLSDTDQALLTLTRRLAETGYRFITPTPSTHRTVLRRVFQPAVRDLRDVFGWSRSFKASDLDPAILRLMGQAQILVRGGGRLKSRLRLSSLDQHFFWHSAFPPRAEDAVFFGPDTYRYTELIKAELPELAVGARIVDIGAGTGAGGVVAQALRPQARVVLADINPAALRLARVNAAFANQNLDYVESDGLAGVAGSIDVAIANPPYIGGSPGRIYRDGGDMLGARLSLDWAKAAMQRLTPGGRLILYTGAAIVGGVDALHVALAEASTVAHCALRYREIDPDVFGTMLLHPAYRRVERIAVVAAVATKQT